MRGKRLQEPVISYILYSALLVRWLIAKLLMLGKRWDANMQSVCKDLFSVGEAWQAVMNVSSFEQLWEFVLLTF